MVGDDQAGRIEEASGIVHFGDGDTRRAAGPSASTVSLEGARGFSSAVVGGEADGLLALVSGGVPDALVVLPARV